MHLHVHISGGFLSSHSRCSAMDSICFGPSGVKCSGSLFPYRRGSPNIPGRNGSNMTVTEEFSAYFPYTVTIRGLSEHGNARLLKMCLTGPVHSHPCPLLSGSAYKWRESQGPGGGPDAALCCFLWPWSHVGIGYHQKADMQEPGAVPGRGISTPSGQSSSLSPTAQGRSELWVHPPGSEGR